MIHILYSGLGGHGNVFFSLVKADENKSFEYEAIFAGVEGIREEYVTKSNFYNVKWQFIKKKRGLDISFNKQMVSAIKNSGSPIIFLHGSRFIILAKMAALLSKRKKKIVVRETQANHLKTKSEWVWLAFAMLIADSIVFLTSNFKEEVKTKLKFLYNPQKVSVISNGIDLDFFKPQSKPYPTPIILGMQSRIVPIKDHATLLGAFALVLQQHPDIKLQLQIAGDGESLPAIKLLAEELKISHAVVFSGMLNETGLVNFMQSLDVYIHASFGETMSTAVMQAMACKLPIIASDVPGINNMIENNKTGILVPVKNKAAMANAIYFIVNNKVATNAMKEAAYNFAVLNYSNISMFAKYQSVFKKILND